MSKPNEDSVENSEDSSDSDIKRSNRWTGPSSTWQSLTAQERGLAASLDQIRDRDLSIHLYNAHALKHRGRELAQTPKTSTVLLPEEDSTFVPPKSWTAWPLPSNHVPRNGEIMGPSDPDEMYTFKRRELARPSRALEAALVGVTLKIAKERFESKKSASGTDGDESKEVKASYDKTENETDLEDGKSNASEDDLSEPSVKNTTKTSSPESFLIPIVSADDERSTDVLRPTIRHTLSKVDEVLMALHHARNICHQYSQSEPASEEEIHVANAVGNKPPSNSKRSVGRPRKILELANRPRVRNSLEEVVEFEPGELFRAKKTHRGRPLKVYEHLDGETQQEYLIRIARIQKKPMPSFATTPEVSPAPALNPKSEKASREKQAAETERSVSRQKKVGLRDWSEVVGVAALVGFSPDVVARATQRCANLFGEGMTMRFMPERPFSPNFAGTIGTYQPQAIPDFGDEPSESSSSEPKLPRPTSSENETESKRPARNPPRKVPRQQNVFCPVDECSRKTTGFRDNPSLKRHLQQIHQISKDQVEEYLLSSDEEMEGAVHTDGFLKPFKPPRGGYARKDKRKRRTSKSDVATSGAGESDSKSDTGEV